MQLSNEIIQTLAFVSEFAASKNKDPYNPLTGIHLDVFETSIIVTAMEGHFLAQRTLERKDAPEHTDTFTEILPLEFVKRILKEKRAATGSITLEGRRLKYEDKDVSFNVEPISADYPDVTSIIEKWENTELKLDNTGIVVGIGVFESLHKAIRNYNKYLNPQKRDERYTMRFGAKEAPIAIDFHDFKILTMPFTFG